MVTLSGLPPKAAAFVRTNCSALMLSSIVKLPESLAGIAGLELRQIEEAQHTHAEVGRDHDRVGGLGERGTVVHRVGRVAGDVAAAVEEHDHRQVGFIARGRQTFR